MVRPVRLQRIDTIGQLGENGGGTLARFGNFGHAMPVRPALKTLLGLVIGLPILVCVLAGVASLLTSMGDAAGAEIVARVQLGCLVLWAACVVGLVIATAIAVLRDGPPDDTGP